MALYLVLVWALGDGAEPKVAMAFEGRVQALEQAQEQDRELLESAQRFRGQGTLFRLLTSDPGLGNTLLLGWTRQRLTDELGWPDSVEGQLWTYSARYGDGLGLRVTIDGGDRVRSVETLDSNRR